MIVTNVRFLFLVEQDLDQQKFFSQSVPHIYIENLTRLFL